MVMESINGPISPAADSTQVTAVTGRVNYSHYRRAVDEVVFPRSVSSVFAPSRTRSIFVTRFFPAKRLGSVNRLWNLGRKRELPSEVIQSSVAQTWSVVEKTADFAGVSPDTLLERR